MLALRHCLVAVAAAACLATSAPVSAALIDYVFAPGTFACIGDQGEGTEERHCHPPEDPDIIKIEGSFTFNTEWDNFITPIPLEKAHITLSGDPFFQIGLDPKSVTFDNGEVTAVAQNGLQLKKLLDDEITLIVNLEFGNALNDLADGRIAPLTSVSISTNRVTFPADLEVLERGGAAVPVPESSSLALIAAALGLFFYGYQLNFIQRRR